MQGKENTQNFQGFLDIASELTVIPKKTKRNCVPLVRAGASRDVVINIISAQISFTVGPVSL